MKALCYKCGHGWIYKGVLGEKIYVTCPGCMLKVRVDKAFIGDSFEQKLLTSLPRTTSSPLKLPMTITTTSSKAEHTHLFNLSDLKEETPVPGAAVIVFNNYSDFLKEIAKREGVITVRPIESDVVIRELPPKTPLEIYQHQISFF